MTSHDDVRRLLRTEGLILRREHPELTGTLDWLRRTARLAQLLPGVYVDPSASTDFHTRVAALSRWAPDAVLCDSTAARLSFWPELRRPDVECVHRTRGEHRGYLFSRRTVPPELVVERNGLRLTSPALTALDLCTQDADPIDRLLRSRRATLAQLWEAFELTPNRAGNEQRFRHLIDSRDKPWSAAERLCHRMLRGAGITGWQANLLTSVDRERYYVDVAFPRLRLAVEIDGRLHETDEDLFESDRWRQNALVLDGWLVLRFTWKMLVEHPDGVIATIRRAMAVRGVI